MSIVLVTYDLNKEGQDYEALYEQIKSLGDCINPLDSVWLIKTDKSCAEVKEHLDPVLDKNDLFLVLPYDKGRAGVLKSKHVEWIKQNI